MITNDFQLSELRELVTTGQTRPEAWRLLQLNRLGRMLEEHENEILDALKNDLQKPRTEAFFEIVALKQELKLVLQQLKRWMRPQKIKVPISLKPGEAFIRYEPLGCVLIIGPWNYPFSLLFQPLISALAAGNTAVLKPSEKAPATSQLIEEIAHKHFPHNVVRVFQGDENKAKKLLKEPFDHIFFTGGGEIGKKIMSAAAEHLTPVTLELGGKSPAIVLENADLVITARRLLWGKSLNAGQTCIAPDHLLVQNQIKEPLLLELKKCLNSFFGPNPIKSPHIAKIINDEQFNRLKSLLEHSRKKNQIIFGGEIDEVNRLIAPTFVEVASQRDPLMSEELFGPIMPVLAIENLEEAILGIREKPHPLAIYMFGGTKIDQTLLLNNTSSGGICFNDVIMQAGIPELPFGGVGASGMGRYHGKAGFETFSNQRSILQRPFWMDIKLRYPPYLLEIKLLKKLLG